MTISRHLLDERPVKRRLHRRRIGHVSIDDLDDRLLAQLTHDARRSFRDMAKELGVSTSTVADRVRRLEASGVAKGYSVIVDHQKLGYDLTAITEIVVSKGRLLDMENAIAKIPGVCAVYDVTGGSDGIVIAKFRDRESLSAFTKSLLSLPFVDRTDTHLVLTTVKEDFRLIPAGLAPK